MVKCYFCNNEMKRKNDQDSISCSINKSHSGIVKFTMRVRATTASQKYRWGNLKSICKNCSIKARRLFNSGDDILKAVANELEELYCGKIYKTMMCKSMEEGNGK